MSCNGKLIDWISEFAAFDQKTARTAAVRARRVLGRKADRVHDEHAAGGRGDHLVQRHRPRFQVKVARTDPASGGVSGARGAQLTSVVGIVEKRPQHAVLEHGRTLRRDPFAIEWSAAQARTYPSGVDHRYSFAADLAPDSSAQPGV